MKKEFNAHEFIREVYLASKPSVDIKKVEKVVAWEHKLSSAKWEELLNEFCGDDDNLQCQCTMWCMNQGPCIYTV